MIGAPALPVTRAKKVAKHAKTKALLTAPVETGNNLAQFEHYTS